MDTGEGAGKRAGVCACDITYNQFPAPVLTC